MVEITFETSLELRKCYMTQRLGTAIESRYLKPIFKTKTTFLGIWRAISLEKKSPVQFFC